MFPKLTIVQLTYIIIVKGKVCVRRSKKKISTASPSLHINIFQQLIGAAFNIVGKNFVLRVSRDHIIVAAKGGSYAAHILQVKFKGNFKALISLPGLFNGHTQYFGRSEERRVGIE